MSTALPSRFSPPPALLASEGDALQRLGLALHQGDPLADAVIEALAELPGAERARHLEGLVGARLTADAPAAVRAMHEAVASVPLWVEWDYAERGARALLSAGLLAGLVLAARCIILGYAAPAGNKPLMLAGGLTKRAPRRLNETSRYVRAVLLPRGLAPGHEGYELSLRVRLMHARVRQLSLRDPRWRSEHYGVPINQHDMAATVVLFSESLIGGLEQLGCRLEDDGEAVIHLWRHAGHLMGVRAELLPTSRREAQRLARLIEASQAPPDDDSRALTSALFEAPFQEVRELPMAEQRAASRRAYRVRELLRVASFELLGPTLAAQLGISPSPWRGALPMLRRLVRGGTLLTRALPGAQEHAVRAGRRYWDMVQEQGLLRYDSAFTLPEQLLST